MSNHIFVILVALYRRLRRKEQREILKLLNVKMEERIMKRFLFWIKRNWWWTPLIFTLWAYDRYLSDWVKNNIHWSSWGPW